MSCRQLLAPGEVEEALPVAGSRGEEAANAPQVGNISRFFRSQSCVSLFLMMKSKTIDRLGTQKTVCVFMQNAGRIRVARRRRQLPASSRSTKQSGAATRCEPSRARNRDLKRRLKIRPRTKLSPVVCLPRQAYDKHIETARAFTILVYLSVCVCVCVCVRHTG